MIDQMAVPIAACGDNRHQDSSWLHVGTSVGKDAQRSPFAVLKKVGWIDQQQIDHSLHTHRFKGGSDNRGVGPRLSCFLSSLGADFDADVHRKEPLVEQIQQDAPPTIQYCTLQIMGRHLSRDRTRIAPHDLPARSP